MPLASGPAMFAVTEATTLPSFFAEMWCSICLLVRCCRGDFAMVVDVLALISAWCSACAAGPEVIISPSPSWRISISVTPRFVAEAGSSLGVFWRCFIGDMAVVGDRLGNSVL